MSQLLLEATIADRPCAFRAVDVLSVVEIGEIVPVPGAPDCVLGLGAMRSQALTVIDCRRAIHFDPDDYARDERSAVIKLEGYSYALAVDRLGDIIEAQSSIEKLPGGFGEAWEPIAEGLVETSRGPVLLLDAAAIVEPGLQRGSFSARVA